MTDTSVPDWDEIRRRYVETQDPVADICRDAGIGARELAAARKRHGWRRANPRPFPPRRPLPAVRLPPVPLPDLPAAQLDTGPPPSDAGEARPSPPAPRRTPSTPAGRRRLLDRLVAAISLKLEQLERRMTQDLAAIAAGDQTATDHERETRAIGALIDNLGKITEIETGLGSPAARRNAASTGTAATATDLADEAERCRRELAERLAKLVEAAGRQA